MGPKNRGRMSICATLKQLIVVLENYCVKCVCCTLHITPYLLLKLLMIHIKLFIDRVIFPSEKSFSIKELDITSHIGDSEMARFLFECASVCVDMRACVCVCWCVCVGVCIC